MTRQTNSMPELKYSEETFRDLYEAVRWVLEDYREDNYTMLKVSTHTQLLKALVKAECK